MSENVRVFTAADLSAEALKGTGKVLVDFWAPWCGPCRMLAPVVDEIAAEKAGSLTVGKLNIDEDTDFAISLRIASIPTLILFKDGVEAGRLVGVYPKQSIVDMIENA